MMSDVEMRERVQPQETGEFLPVFGEESARTGGARVGHDEANVKVVRSFGEFPEKALFGKVHAEGAVFHAKLDGKRVPCLLQQRQASGDEHRIETFRRQFPGVLEARSRT